MCPLARSGLETIGVEQEETFSFGSTIQMFHPEVPLYQENINDRFACGVLKIATKGTTMKRLGWSHHSKRITAGVGSNLEWA